MARRTSEQAKAEHRALLLGVLAKITEPKRVVGLDLSMQRPGFAVVYGPGNMHTQHMVTKPVPGVYGYGHGERLLTIVKQALALAQGSSVRADLIVVEAAFGGSLGNNDGIGLVMVLEALAIAFGLGDIPIVTATNNQIKKYATANGTADKAEMALAARDLLGWTGTVHDEADALWAAAYGWALLGAPIVELPKTYTVVIDRHLGRPVPKATKRKAMA